MADQAPLPWTGKLASGTWFAIRRVIVVVFPEPAPASTMTGPRTLFDSVTPLVVEAAEDAR